MRDYMSIGPTPAYESCAQVGELNYRIQATKEMEVYIDMLYRVFEETITGTTVSFKMKWFPHDFGTYGEVIISYDDNEKDTVAAYEIENNLPELWDEEARKQLQGEKQ